jgi:hypothetical protein
MSNIKEVCEKMVTGGEAKQIGSGFQITVPINQDKLHRLEQSYTRSFDTRVRKREKKEREAATELRNRGL